MKVYLAVETAPGSIETVRETIRDFFIELTPHQVFGIYDLLVFIDDDKIATPSEFYDKYIVPISSKCEDKIRGTNTFFVLKTNKNEKEKKDSSKISAYVLLSLIPHLGDFVYERTCALKNISFTSLCSGVFDSIVEIESDSLDTVSGIVDEIQTIPGVMKTVTVIVKLTQ